MQNALPQADLGVATSSNTFFFQIGCTIGAAAFLSIAYSTAGPRDRDRVRERRPVVARRRARTIPGRPGRCAWPLPAARPR